MRRVGRVIAAIAVFGFGYLAFLYLTLPDVRELRTQNLESTAFMRLREREARAEGRDLKRVHRWVPYSRISPHLKRAVLVAEDADSGAMKASTSLNQEGARVGESVTSMRGASTIHTAGQNLYLSPTRNPFRKLTELLITRRSSTS